MLITSWKSIAAICWLLTSLPACRGSPLSNLATNRDNLYKRSNLVSGLDRRNSNLTLPGLTTAADNITRPNSLRSPWPPEITVEARYPFAIKIQKVEALTDESQIRDIEAALVQVMDTICTDGYRLYRSVQPHTLSESILSSVMSVLQNGQITHGPAAVSGEVWHPKHMIMYGDFAARIGTPPSGSWQPWPVGTLRRAVPGFPGLRMEIETFGPPLDNWDTKWFLKLCEQIIEMLLRQRPSERVAPIEQILDPQRDGVKFYPIATAGASPLTNRMLIAVLQIMKHDVFARYGAREVRFSVLAAQGHNLLGWGLFGLYVLPGSLGSGGNSTNLSISTDGGNGIGNGGTTNVATS